MYSVRSLLLTMLPEQKPQKSGITNLPLVKEDSTPLLLNHVLKKMRDELKAITPHNCFL